MNPLLSYFCYLNILYAFYNFYFLLSEPGLKLQLNNGVFSYTSRKYQQDNTDEIPSTSYYNSLPGISDGYIGPVSFSVFEVC